jgi:beta-lactamase superfamily II metal-dependent hydrolase
MSAPVLQPVPSSTLAARESGDGALLKAIKKDPDALVYFLVNVGDGDTQLIVLPRDSNDGVRRLVVVDVCTTRKLPALIDALHDAGIIEAPGTSRQIPLLVVTHPHNDHIGGMTEFVRKVNGPSGCIEQVWEPGYFMPTPPFHALMSELEGSPWIRRLQPTAGTTLTLDSVRFTVLGPGVGLRNRFDTYGVEINDSSITLMVDYPAARVFAEPAHDRINRRAAPAKAHRLLLGADAQFTSWAQTTVDFPDLVQEQNETLAKELRTAIGIDYLKADLFKLSHHASKHGVTLELVERVGAPITLVSSGNGGGKYGFPHLLAMEAAREARQSTTTKSTPREPDGKLGIHVTGSVLDDGTPAGSIAAVVPRAAGSPIQLFRLGDDRDENITLANARRVT